MSTIQNEVLVFPDTVRSFGYSALRRVGVSANMYKPVIDGLVETSLRGVDSHGIRLIPHYVRAVLTGRINKDAKFSFWKKAPSVGLVDADAGFGIAAGVYAMDQAIKLANSSGVGAVSVRNSSHFGAAAIFGLRAAKKNMIGMVFTDVDSLSYPFGGVKTFFGTNPICFTAPMGREGPFCLDMATTRVAFNKILAYRSLGKPLDVGWGADENGIPTTDATKAVSPIPIGDYKGYGLAMMVAIFSSLLAGVPYGPDIPAMFPLDGRRRNLGHFFLAIDIKRFRPISQFKRDLQNMSNMLRLITPVDPAQPVIVSGDLEKKQFSIRRKYGIPVPKHDIDEILFLAKEINIDSHIFFQHE